MIEEDNLNNLEKTGEEVVRESEQKRLRFNDLGRGFIVLYLVIGAVFPPEALRKKISA
jgi:hypothetical protein